MPVVTGMTLFMGMALLFVGCQTAPKKAEPKAESPQEIMRALGTVTEGLTNSSVSKEDLKRLGQQVEKDPQARSALTAVNSAFNVEDTGVKYCPVDGKRYSSRIEFCPNHKDVKLLRVE